jgi:HPt (histidine-containing phosphotransfer) domain-containing protein
MTQTPDPAAEQQMRQQVRTLAERFLRRTTDQVAAFREQLSRLSQGDTSVLQAVQDVAHKIHGSGAVFGFPQLSDCAEVLERTSAAMVKATAGGGPSKHVEYTEQLSVLVEKLARAVESESRLFWNQ